MNILQRIVDGLVSVNDFQSGFVPERHYRCNLCGLANAGEMPSSEQTYLYDLSGPRWHLTVSTEYSSGGS